MIGFRLLRDYKTEGRKSAPAHRKQPSEDIMLQALLTLAKAGLARALNHRASVHFAAAWPGRAGRAFLALNCLWLLQAPVLAQEQNHSVRVATYNAYLLSPLFKCLPPGPLILDCLNQVTNQTEGWAQRLADTILADAERFDILVLNEVWDEDAKNILVQRLKAKFPVYVKKLDAPLVQLRAQLIGGLPVFNGVKLNGEDSGLMLFARQGFSALSLPSTRYRWGGSKGELRASTRHVAFKLFEAFDSDDGYAAKGVGFVRLRDNTSGVVYNVAFTHLQADYPKDNGFFGATRKKQFADIKRVVERTLAPLGPLEDLLQRERLIIAGDLNVAVLSHGKNEWKALFDSAGSFFTRPVYDAWNASSPDASRGETNEVDEDRLDYVLASVEPYKHGLHGRIPMCVQHTTIPVDFKNLESDHFMVHADLNRGFFHCHPRIAYEVKTSELNGSTLIDKHPDNNALDITRIAYPGALQWFHVKTDSPGTYSILRYGLGTPVRIDIYAPEDLTTPISRYNKTTTKIPFGGVEASVDQFVLPKEYYIRISGPTRAWTGNYALQIRRHTCATKEMACYLQPGQPQTARLTGAGEQNTVGDVQNEAWFRFDVTGQSDTGVAQTIQVSGVGLPSTPGHSAQLVDFNNTGSLGALNSTALPNGLRVSGPAGDGTRGYLVLKQSSPGSQGITVVGHFDTSLRLLDVGNLICADETNPEIGSDDIYTLFFIDGSSFRYPAAGYREFDCDNTRHSRDWSQVVGRKTIVFVDSVKIRVLEEDDTSADDDGRDRAIPTLSPLESKQEGKLRWLFSDGDYEFFYIVRKRPNGPVANP